jgi:hypothetical protein
MRFQRACIDPSQAGRAAIGHKYLSVFGDHACRFGKSLQRRDVFSGIVVDHLNTVTARMRDENTAGFRIKRAVVERTPSGVRYLDYANLLQRHGTTSKA